MILSPYRVGKTLLGEYFCYLGFVFLCFFLTMFTCTRILFFAQLVPFLYVLHVFLSIIHNVVAFLPHVGIFFCLRN